VRVATGFLTHAYMITAGGSRDGGST